MMKKILFLAILLPGLIPCIKNGSLHICATSAMAQTMGEENDWGDDLDDWWDMSEDDFSSTLDDGGFFDDFSDISDDFDSWVSAEDGAGSDPGDTQWTWLDEVTVYANANVGDGIDWSWLQEVVVTATTNSSFNIDDYDWMWLENEMLYMDDPNITGYDPTYTYPEPVTDPPVDKPKPKYVKQNLKLTMRSQTSEKSCVPATMSYLDQAFCGGAKSEQDYITNYNSSHAYADVAADGVPPSQIQGYVDANFTTTPYNGNLTELLDQGYPVLTTINNGTTTDPLYHSVVIIGYDTSSDPANPVLYYMDPEYGRQSSIKFNKWNTGDQALYAYPIVSCK